MHLCMFVRVSTMHLWTVEGSGGGALYCAFMNVWVGESFYQSPRCQMQDNRPTHAGGGNLGQAGTFGFPGCSQPRIGRKPEIHPEPPPSFTTGMCCNFRQVAEKLSHHEPIDP